MIARILLFALLGQVPDAGIDSQSAGFVASTVGVAAAIEDLKQALDAGTGIERLYADCPVAPPVEPVDGGYFTPELRQRRENCRIAACEAELVPRLDEGGDSHPGTVLILAGGGVVVLALGVVLGFFLPHPVLPPPR